MVELQPNGIMPLRTGVTALIAPAEATAALTTDGRPNQVRRTAGEFLPRRACARYSASGVGLADGGSILNVAAVRQVIEKPPVVATSATRLSSPIVFSAAA